MNKFYIILIAVLLTGCGSGPSYTYFVKPTPLKENTTKYYLGKIDVNLTLGHGAIVGDKTFATQSMVTKQFKIFFIKHLKEEGVFAKSKSSADAIVNVTVDYKRTYNYGGKSLNKPTVSHSIEIIQNKLKVASLSHGNYTTRHGYLKDLAVNIEIASFNWDEEDEPEDIELVAKLIAGDIAKAGS